MFSYSEFIHNDDKTGFPFEAPISNDYKVYLNGTEIPVYTCRISKFPFNTWWPGHQRPINQTVIVSYINIISDEEIQLKVVPSKKDFVRTILKPYSKNVHIDNINGELCFKLKENGGYVLELDGYTDCLYIFNNKPVECDNAKNVTHYFGPGIHFPGKITLNSNERIYLDKDALVFGCIYANKAENIRIYGNGVMDDSFEERYNQHCYTSYTNGNVKLYECKNVIINGLGFTNSALWCVNLFNCFDVEIDSINVFGQWRYNTDGIDIVNCQRVSIRNSFVHSFDDTIVVKGIDKYMHTNNFDILTENCVLWCDWGKTCEIGLETSCSEYNNIVFKNIDILRAGNTACDIQNGDFAEVHDVVFDNIRVEIESFYTQSEYQKSQSDCYTKEGTYEIPYIFSVDNSRFRTAYSFLNFHETTVLNKEGESNYAGVHDIKVNNIQVFADDLIIKKSKKECLKILVRNIIPTTLYENIIISNIYLNDEKITKDNIDIHMSNDGIVENFYVDG